MFSLDDFRAVTLEDKQLFDDLYEKYHPFHSDYMFTTMISWMQYMDYHYAEVDGCVAIMVHRDNKRYFRPLVGNPSKQVTEEYLRFAGNHGSDPPLVLIDEPTKKKLSHMFPEVRFRADRDYFDYVYRTQDLISLEGSEYAKIRNKLNKFTRQYLFTVEPVTEDSLSEVNAFLNRWCLWKDCVKIPMLEYEKRAVLYSMAHFLELELSGLILRIDDNIEGLSVFEPISDDTLVVHYEKGITDFEGIYQVINQETAKSVENQYAFINRESDLGQRGLRQAKKSYRPHHMVKVYHLDRKFLPSA